jgi:hypothetical protein
MVHSRRRETHVDEVWPGKKTKSQFYVGAEDVFTNLYHAKGNTMISGYSGDEIKDSNSTDFYMGIPMVSIGMSWSY